MEIMGLVTFYGMITFPYGDDKTMEHGDDNMKINFIFFNGNGDDYSNGMFYKNFMG